jgi:hypothetical protein
LGHIIGNNTIRPDSKLIKAILEYPEPINVKEVQHFHGLSNFVRKYIKHFSHIYKPLTGLTQKNKAFIFGPEQKQAFSQLMSELSKQPVLSIYGPDIPLELHTDASAVVIGAMLMQNSHPIGYFSRKINKAESNYSSSDLECLAVIEACKHFKIYLQRVKFTIITDHSALQWLFRMKDDNRRIFHWSVLLSVYDNKVVHRPGKQMSHVDALSRSPVNLLLTHEAIRKAQCDANMLSDTKPGILRVKQRGKSRIIIPSATIPEVLQTYNDNCGHPGTNKCLKTISNMYIWDGMKDDIMTYVRTIRLLSLHISRHSVLFKPRKSQWNCWLWIQLLWAHQQIERKPNTFRL